MNIHLPTILMFTRGAWFWPIPILVIYCHYLSNQHWTRGFLARSWTLCTHHTRKKDYRWDTELMSRHATGLSFPKKQSLYLLDFPVMKSWITTGLRWSDPKELLVCISCQQTHCDSCKAQRSHITAASRDYASGSLSTRVCVCVCVCSCKSL